MAANQTNIKNTAIGIPGYEERNKVNKGWSDGVQTIARANE
jgi:hypothetical protein